MTELLPAMGYGRRQMEELRETIARSDADLVLIGTPIDLRRLIELDKPALRVTYRLQEMGEPTLPRSSRARLAQADGTGMSAARRARRTQDSRPQTAEPAERRRPRSRASPATVARVTHRYSAGR